MAKNNEKDVKAAENSAKAEKKDKSKKAKKPNKVAQYFRDLKAELKKVVWPTKAQVINNTGVVLATMIILGLFVGGLDAIFSGALKFLMSLGG